MFVCVCVCLALDTLRLLVLIDGWAEKMLLDDTLRNAIVRAYVLLSLCFCFSLSVQLFVVVSVYIHSHCD